MKKTIMTVFFIFSCVCLQAQTLTWDIKFLKGRTQESIPVNQIIRMETGDVFLVTITPASDCFCYVVLNDSERQITLLYDEPLKGGNEIMLGPFETEDPPGTETIYVIMSQTKQIRLEELIQLHKNDPSLQSANNLFREVVSLQNAASSLGEPSSVFIAGGGTSRGDSQEYVTRFTDKDMYVRAISIRH